MKEIRVRERFIDLRAQGFSLAKIAEELGIAKQTAINWEKAYEAEIADLKAMEMERLYTKYLMKKEDNMMHFVKLLKRMRKELKSRDLSEFNTKELLELDFRLTKKLQDEYREPEFIGNDRVYLENIFLEEGRKLIAEKKLDQK